MKLSTRSTYGLRAMLAFAMQYGQGPVLLREIAERQHLPVTYLEQLMVPLRKAGLLAAKRGSAGGYTLMDNPAEIPVSSILRALEGPLNLVEGPTHLVENDAVAYECGKTHKCALRELLDDAGLLLNDYFSRVSLADLVKRQHDIEKELRVFSDYVI